MTGSKSLLTKSIGIGCRLPLSANFDFWESRPFLPLVNCSLVMYYPLRIAFVLNASLPMGLFKTALWIGMDWILWLGMTLYCMLWKTIVTDVVWKLVLWNSIKVMCKVLALGPPEVNDSDDYDDGTYRDDGKVDEARQYQKREKEELNSDHGDDDQLETNASLRKLENENRARHFLGREYPPIPKKRRIIYSRGISERLGVNLGMHLSKAQGFEVRCAWWHSCLSTVDNLSCKLDSLKSALFQTSKCTSKLKTGSLVAKALGGKVASLGIVWGGFHQEAMHYFCSSTFSVSGVYPLETIRRIREIQVERRSRQIIEKRLDSQLKKTNVAKVEEDYEEVVEVKVGAS